MKAKCNLSLEISTKDKTEISNNDREIILEALASSMQIMVADLKRKPEYQQYDFSFDESSAEFEEI